MEDASQVHSEQQSSRRSLHANTCKLCHRRFPSGRALGGHMRSHVMSSSSSKSAPPPSSYSSSSSSSIPAQELPENLTSAFVATNGFCYALRENPKKNPRFVDSEHLRRSNSSAVLPDNESETECCRKSLVGAAAIPISRRRTKRRRRSSPKAAAAAEAEPRGCSVSDTTAGEDAVAAETEPLGCSVSDTTADEDAVAAETEPRRCSGSDTTADEDAVAAECLVMLSRGSWFDIQREEGVTGKKRRRTEWGPLDEERKLLSIDRSKKPSEKASYSCCSCDKSFPSYQALGGHLSNHKKLKPPIRAVIDTAHNCRVAKEPGIGQNGDGRGIHVCPICLKAFGSRQALGGHKRAHIMAGDCPPPARRPRATHTGNAVKPERSFIDLNLPATMEDGGNGGTPEVSVLSFTEQTAGVQLLKSVT